MLLLLKSNDIKDFYTSLTPSTSGSKITKLEELIYYS